MPFFESVTIILAFYLYNFSACQEYVFFFLFVIYQSLLESMNPLSETLSNLLSSYVILGDYGMFLENSNNFIGEPYLEVRTTSAHL